MNKLEDFIIKNHLLYDKWVKKDDTKPPNLVLSRTWSGLLLLTQATAPSQNITKTIVDIAITLDPIMDDIGCYAREKYNHLINIDSWVHNRDYDKKEYINRVVMAYPPLEYILYWYLHADFETPFDLTEYAKQCSIMKSFAEEEFCKSVWSK